MKLSQKVVDAINEQINNEFYAAHLYLSMVAFFDRLNLEGFAHWMRMQFQEEEGHALKFFDFLLDHDADIRLATIDGPAKGFDTPVEAVRTALEHEQEVTRQVGNLYELSMQEKAYSAKVMLEWFIDEQVEEEKNTRTILEKLEMIGDDKAALFVLDSELGGRSAGA